MTNFGSIIHDALRSVYKGCDYACGETYESLQWFDKKTPKPTEADLLSAIEKYKANQSTYDADINAAIAFPSIKSLLQALWDGMDKGEIPKSTKFYDLIKASKTSGAS